MQLGSRPPLSRAALYYGIGPILNTSQVQYVHSTRINPAVSSSGPPLATSQTVHIHNILLKNKVIVKLPAFLYQALNKFLLLPSSSIILHWHEVEVDFLQ